MLYSYIFQKTYVENNEEKIIFKGIIDEISHPSLQNVISYLNGLKGFEGFIFKNFSKNGSPDIQEPRNYFSSTNAKKIDVIREKIEVWKKDNRLSEIEYNILLCSIIEKLPSVSNISGTYGAYLKINDPRMFKPFLIEMPILFTNNLKNKSFNEDANKLIKKVSADILYIDPPYNHRQYPSNYHLWETIAVWDKKIKNTKTGIRNYEEQKSKFCSKIKCVETFQSLIKNAMVSYILFSYNSEGIMSFDTINDILHEKGKVTFYKKIQRRYKSNSNGIIKPTIDEWLFFVKTRK